MTDGGDQSKGRASTVEAMREAVRVLDEKHRYTELHAEFKCRACDDGVVRCAITFGNRHTKGSCSTPGCVNWIA